MSIDLTRRNIVTGAPTIALGAILAGCAVRQTTVSSPTNLYRTDDEARIMAAAKAILEEDYVATLITVDGSGIPRARSVGVWAPDNDFVLWIGTRRTSRKVSQIRDNPNATLHFANDDAAGNFANAYYASFMGTASVHVDEATVQLRAPEEKYRRRQWPNFPHDYAAIRFQTKWLEVTGHGIAGDEANWQPQAVVLDR